MILYGGRWISSSLLLSVLALAVGCGAQRTPVNKPVAVIAPTPPAVQDAPRPAAVRASPTKAPDSPTIPTEAEMFSRLSVAELNAKKPLSDAYFAVDTADLTDLGRTALQLNAGWLNKWRTVRVVIEGHADERGTNEYNLALGEERAVVVRTYLEGLGVDASRIHIVSKGEEQPSCRQHEEGCWGQNRRAHFIITAK